MKKYFDVSHFLAFLFGGFLWSLVYIVMHLLAVAKLLVEKGLIP